MATDNSACLQCFLLGPVLKTSCTYVTIVGHYPTDIQLNITVTIIIIIIIIILTNPTMTIIIIIISVIRISVGIREINK
jgi:hypothetical protein